MVLSLFDDFFCCIYSEVKEWERNLDFKLWQVIVG